MGRGMPAQTSAAAVGDKLTNRAPSRADGTAPSRMAEAVAERALSYTAAPASAATACDLTTPATVPPAIRAGRTLKPLQVLPTTSVGRPVLDRVTRRNPARQPVLRPAVAFVHGPDREHRDRRRAGGLL
jgi:hypothetical protein